MKRILISFFFVTSYISSFGQTLLEEDFSVFPPENWTRGNAVLNNVYNGTQISTISYGWYAETNGYGIEGNHTKADIYGASIKYWLISPTISLNTANNMLMFNFALTDDDANTPVTTVGSDDKFVVLVLPENQSINSANELLRLDNTSTVRLEDISSDTLITLSLNNYNGNVRIAFYVESSVSNADYDLHIGHVFVGRLQGCPPPSFQIENISSSSASIVTDSDSSAESLLIQLSEAEDTYWENSLEDTVHNLSQAYNINNLLPNHSYKVRVKSICESLESDYSLPQIFTTLCNNDTIRIFDTVTIVEHDTITMFDTISITSRDTVTLFDTIYITSNDTVTLFDTIYITSNDTVTLFDTIYITSNDTVTLFDTVYITSNDTVTLFDTIYIYDTITNCGIDKTHIYAIINQGELYQDYGFNESNAGEYCQTMQNEAECDSIVCLHLSVYSSLFIAEQEENFLVYPNPVKDKIYIKGEGKLTITDNMGKTIFKEQTDNKQRIIDTKKFKSGVYYIKLGNRTQKIIIQK